MFLHHRIDVHLLRCTRFAAAAAAVRRNPGMPAHVLVDLEDLATYWTRDRSSVERFVFLTGMGVRRAVARAVGMLTMGALEG